MTEIEDGEYIHSNVVPSQAALHAQYGSIVLEIASRQLVRDSLDFSFSGLNTAVAHRPEGRLLPCRSEAQRHRASRFQSSAAPKDGCYGAEETPLP